MSANMKDLLEFSKELHAVGGLSDEKMSRITARAKANELSKRIPKIQPMSGEEIRAVRAKYGMSQAVLASTMGMTVASVSKWERGEIKPSGPALRLLNTLAAKGPDIFTC
ncbi:helix-turn-helix domain-containing protein [Enterobacter sp.]|jgi:putative transcriptional regulator|uniref:helix-turn-helix domain-containing protein n=1 Tax=Enterobacter sp. TaxID=42895 RepID=UPI00296FFC5A|nr:helix-turn-helix domain-containing protein [Enterobacter sp.]